MKSLQCGHFNLQAKCLILQDSAQINMKFHLNRHPTHLHALFVPFSTSLHIFTCLANTFESSGRLPLGRNSFLIICLYASHLLLAPFPLCSTLYLWLAFCEQVAGSLYLADFWFCQQRKWEGGWKMGVRRKICPFLKAFGGNEGGMRSHVPVQAATLKRVLRQFQQHRLPMLMLLFRSPYMNY